MGLAWTYAGSAQPSRGPAVSCRAGWRLVVDPHPIWTHPAMAETEVPEAKNPFEKRVAITIAIIAILLAFNESRNDNAKTDAILKSIEASEVTTEASNKWAYFQAKSVKEHTYAVQEEVLPAVASGDAAVREKTLASFAKKVDKYEHEKEEIKKEAEAKEAHARALRQVAKQNIAVNERLDHAALPLQIAVILCSIAILVGIHVFWWLGLATAVIGAGILGSSFLMRVDDIEEEEAPTATAPLVLGAKPAEHAVQPEAKPAEHAAPPEAKPAH